MMVIAGVIWFALVVFLLFMGPTGWVILAIWAVYRSTAKSSAEREASQQRRHEELIQHMRRAR